MDIATNLLKLKQSIASLADSKDIMLLAASKTQSISTIRSAYSAGQCEFGENYVQEALEKIEALTDLNINWHFIGHLQSNKTKLVAENFAWVHSVDSKKIAERLSKQRPTHLPPLNILLAVNIDEEKNKSGISLDQIPELASYIMSLPRLQLHGLMTMPKARQDFDEQRKPFKQLKLALTNLQHQYPEVKTLDTLSMGMSNDWQAAIAEGANIIRIGTALFGKRKRG